MRHLQELELVIWGLLSLLTEAILSKDDSVLFPKRKVQSSTVIDALPEYFRHYKKGVGGRKISAMKPLRKSYISLVQDEMQK